MPTTAPSSTGKISRVFRGRRPEVACEFRMVSCASSQRGREEL